MTNGFPKQVHIIPLGHEFDRAVRPFDRNIVYRVYLIVDTGDGTSNGKSERDKSMTEIQKTMYTPRVKKYLEEKGIEVRVVETLTFDLEILLRALTSIIRLEQDLGNEIHINMSSSGRLGAVGAFMAGTVYNVPTYYVHSDRFANDDERKEHGVSVCLSENISFLPDFKFEKPDSTEARILEYLYTAKKDSESQDGISSMDIVTYLEENKVKDFILRKYNSDGNITDIRTENSRRLMRLMIIMKKLVDDDKYVISYKSGRKMMYSLTKLGEHAFCLCGMDKDKYAKQFHEITAEEK